MSKAIMATLVMVTGEGGGCALVADRILGRLDPGVSFDSHLVMPAPLKLSSCTLPIRCSEVLRSPLRSPPSLQRSSADSDLIPVISSKSLPLCVWAYSISPRPVDCLRGCTLRPLTPRPSSRNIVLRPFDMLLLPAIGTTKAELSLRRSDVSNELNFGRSLVVAVRFRFCCCC